MAGKKRVRARKKVGLAGAPLDKGWPTFKFYVHYQCDDKECHEIAKNYVRRNFSKGEAQAILVHPKHTIASHDFAAMLHWINLGNDFPESYARAPEYIANLFADLIKSGKAILKLLSKKKKAKPTIQVTIQDRMRAHTLATVIPELYKIEDAWLAGKKPPKYNLYQQLTIHNVKRVIEVNDWIHEHLDDYLGVLEKSDKQLVESYRHLTTKDLKARVKLLNTFLDDLEKFKDSKNATRTFKPKTKKIKSVDKQVEKMKFEKTNAEYKLTSVNPLRIPGCMHLYMFNTKTRQLTVFDSDGPDGLTVSGTTVKGFNPETSLVMKLRKPEDVLPIVLKKSPLQVGKALKSIRASKKAPSGRTNEHMVILRCK